MAFPLAVLSQVAGWDIDTVYLPVMIGLGIVDLILVLVYVALYTTTEES